MSYDIWLEVDLGGDEPARVGALDWNYTSNVSPMWRLAMPRTSGLAGMDGMKAGAAAEELRRGISYMRRHPTPFRRMNPSSRWGSYEGQLEALGELLCAFEESPEAKVAVYR